MELFKKSIKIIKKEGFLIFLKKAGRFFFQEKGFLLLIEQEMIQKIRFFREKVIQEIKSLNSNDIEAVVNFAFHRFFGFIKPAQIKSELKVLLQKFQKKAPKIILEIGTANGGTLFCFSKLAPDGALIISIDLPGGMFGGGYPEWKIPIYEAFKKENQKLYLLREDSHKKETLEKVKTILNGGKIDFLFIDGDHTYQGVKKDFEMYGQLVEKNGVIAFHDIVYNMVNGEKVEVPLFWQEIKNNFEHQEIIENRNQLWGGIGVIIKK